MPDVQQEWNCGIELQAQFEPHSAGLAPHHFRLTAEFKPSHFYRQLRLSRNGLGTLYAHSGPVQQRVTGWKKMKRA